MSLKKTVNTCESAAQNEIQNSRKTPVPLYYPSILPSRGKYKLLTISDFCMSHAMNYTIFFVPKFQTLYLRFCLKKFISTIKLTWYYGGLIFGFCIYATDQFTHFSYQYIPRLDHCDSTVSPEFRESSHIALFQYCWAILSSLHFHVNFKTELSILKKRILNPLRILIWGSSVSIHGKPGQAIPFY